VNLTVVRSTALCPNEGCGVVIILFSLMVVQGTTKAADAWPLTVTMIDPPLVTAEKNVAVIEVEELTMTVVADVPLKETVLMPWVVASKPVPVMVTVIPVVLLVIIMGVTVKLDVVDTVWPPTVTLMGPVVAPEGTGTVILVLVALAGIAVVPLNLTVLLAAVASKPVPVMVTFVVVTGPNFGVKSVIVRSVVFIASPQPAKNNVESRDNMAKRARNTEILCMVLFLFCGRFVCFY
jgi:hypothetical protein